MDRITVKDLPLRWRVGVTGEERAWPQRILLTIEMDLDFSACAKSDSLKQTVDYFALARRLRQWGDDKSWNLIETIAVQAANLILAEFKPESVTVEVQKFVLAETGCVSAKVTRP